MMIVRPTPINQRRIVLCRKCGAETGLPGAAYCDRCRYERISDDLMSDVDTALDELEPGARVRVAWLSTPPGPGWILTVDGVGYTRALYENLAEAVAVASGPFALEAATGQPIPADDPRWNTLATPPRADR